MRRTNNLNTSLTEIKYLYDNYPKKKNFYSDLIRAVIYYKMLRSIRYKLYKSAFRRWVFPVFYLSRFFLKFFKNYLVSNFFRKRFQHQDLNSVFFPGSLISKRMFLNHVGFFDLLSKNNLDYFWYNGSYYSLMKDNKFFFKKQLSFVNNGNSILISNKFTADLNELQQVYLFKKSFISSDKILFDFNFLFFFSLSLEMTKNIYLALTYLYFNRVLKLIFRFF